MPQMAPLSWLIMYFIFLLIFLMFNIINFYSFNYSIKYEKKPKLILNYNWKW